MCRGIYCTVLKKVSEGNIMMDGWIGRYYNVIAFYIVTVDFVRIM